MPWVHHLEVYLADYDHTVLRRVATGGEVASPDEWPVLDSPPGEVFRTQQPRWEVEGPDPVLWVALTNRWRRLGVVRLRLGALEGAGPRDARADEAGVVASALAQVLDTADAYTDAFRLCRRRRGLSVSAEMQWDLLPPLTLATPSVAVAGLMEPAYEVGGDCFDYSSNGTRLDLAIFDPVGHSIASSMVAALTMGTYRHRAAAACRSRASGPGSTRPSPPTSATAASSPARWPTSTPSGGCCGW